MAEKMTQKDMFALIAEKCADDAMIVEFCETKIAQLSKPRSRKTKPEVTEFRAAVSTFLSEQDGPVTNKQVAEAMEVTAQKSSAALRYLVAEGIAKRTEGEKKTDPAVFEIA